MTNEQLKALKMICDAVTDSVKLAGTQGAPGGVIYAALMASGCTLNQFQTLMGGLVNAGKLEKRGELYFVP